MLWWWWLTWQFLILSTSLTTMCVGSRRHCRWQGQPRGGDHGGTQVKSWSITSIKILGLLLLLADLHLLLLPHVDVMNLCVVTLFEAVKYLHSHHQHSLSNPTLNDWRIFRLKWYFMMSHGCPGCHGYPAYFHHDKFPPWWVFVSDDYGGKLSGDKIPR